MPIFKHRVALELARNVRLFFNLEAGVTGLGSFVRQLRGQPVSKDSKSTTQATRGNLPQNQHVKRAAEQKVEQTRGRKTKQDQEIEELRAELDQFKSAGYPAGNPDAREKMFFLLGRGKSGTTWLLRLLDAHQEITCNGEGNFFGESAPQTLQGALTRSEEVQRWLGNNPWTKRKKDPDLGDILERTITYLMLERLGKTGKTIVGDKSLLRRPETLRNAATIFPSTKVVHIIRDGRDVAVSFNYHRWNRPADEGGPFNLKPDEVKRRDAYRSNPEAFGPEGTSIFAKSQVKEFAEQWRNAVGQAVEDAALLGENYCQVYYENLLADPVGELRRVLEFLGAEADEESARRCVETASFEQMSGRERGMEDSTSFFRKGISGDWKNYFTEHDKQVFKDEAGELLIQLGYEDNHDW